MLKAVIFYPHIGEYGGIERNIIALASEIHRKDIKPVLVCFYDKIDMHKYYPELQVVQLGDHLNPIVKAFRLKKYLAENESVGMPFFFGSKAGFYGGLANIKPYVLHYTDPPSLLSSGKKNGSLKDKLQNLRNRFSDQIINLGVKRATLCLTMTNWNSAELESIYKRKFDVVHQGGVPPTEINTAERCKGNTLRLFSICRLSKSKKLRWILESVAQLKSDQYINQNFQKVEVVIAGNGPDASNLKELVKKLNLADIVSFPGFLSAEEVEHEYGTCDLFLVPGQQGYGLPVLEALYRHVPVVLNIESRISEILQSNPWAKIAADSAGSFTESILEHIIKLKVDYPDATVLAELPTEQQWAAQIGEFNKWW